MTDMNVLRAKLVKVKAIRDRARQGKVTEAESERRRILAKVVEDEARREEAQGSAKVSSTANLWDEIPGG
jgi:hypothetical protein